VVGKFNDLAAASDRFLDALFRALFHSDSLKRGADACRFEDKACQLS
jgi:hypothetical protein